MGILFAKCAYTRLNHFDLAIEPRYHSIAGAAEIRLSSTDSRNAKENWPTISVVKQIKTNSVAPGISSFRLTYFLTHQVIVLSAMKFL